MAFVMSWPQDKDEVPVAEDLESHPSTDCGIDDLHSESASADSDNDEDTFALCPVDETLVVLDWDDTLLPTSWLTARGLGLNEDVHLTQDQVEHLALMAGLAEETLRTARALGSVVIVTNAEDGWVEMSCEKFMPSLCPLLRTVRILSARSTYEPQGVARPSEWKYWAFKNEIHGFYDARACENFKHIISIGDSLHERNAAIQASANLSNSYVKILKLKAKPELDELMQQHQLVVGCLADVACHQGHLDVCIQ